MADFTDHIEDFDEEGDEFRAAIENALEEETGIEWEATDIYDREQVNRVDVSVIPKNAGESLTAAFGSGVSVNGSLSINFSK